MSVSPFDISTMTRVDTMPIDDSPEVIVTNSRMHMNYRAYTLHPNVDDYFYYNYPHYKTTPLIQNAYFLLDCKKKDLTGFAVNVPVHVQGNICTDIFIKFGHLHSTCIHSINVQISGFRTDHGIYNMDWLTIYMYNLRQHPELVAQNIFILPNLTLLASTLYNYIINIKFNHDTLYDYVFVPWRRAVSAHLLPEISGQIMKYVPNHVLIDIWARSDMYNKSNLQNMHSQIFSILKSSFKLIYMSNYLLDCNSDRVITVNIHKNAMHNNLLFSYIHKDTLGHWQPVPRFNKLVINIGTVCHTIMEHELAILPCLYNIHYVKQVKPLKEYTIPSKFKLTNNITDSGVHPNMYLVQLSDYVDHSLIMGNGEDQDEDDLLITLTFYQKYEDACPPHMVQLYVELSTK